MNLTQGHGEKIKFGSASAIFLVTCENTMGLLADTFLLLSSFCASLLPSHPKIQTFLWGFEYLTS